MKRSDPELVAVADGIFLLYCVHVIVVGFVAATGTMEMAIVAGAATGYMRYSWKKACAAANLNHH